MSGFAIAGTTRLPLPAQYAQATPHVRLGRTSLHVMLCGAGRALTAPTSHPIRFTLAPLELLLTNATGRATPGMVAAHPLALNARYVLLDFTLM